MLKRILTGLAIIIFLAIFMICGYFISTIFIDMLILIFLAGAVYEMHSCLKKAGYDMYIAPAIIMLLLAYPVFYLMQHYLGGSAGVQGLLIVLLVSLMACLSIFTFRPLMKKSKVAKKEETQEDEDIVITIAIKGAPNTQKSSQTGLNSLFANVFLIAYPMIFMAVAWIVGYKYSAIFAILYAIAVPAIGSDMFAYFVGSAIGGKKLCPTISPKKTIAGAVGGLIGGMVLSILFWVVFEYIGELHPAFAEGVGYIPFISHADGGWMWKSALIYLALGLVCGFVSELGDLSASAIKRAIGIKDYGNIFPGHGGFMDRIDSVMYSLVVLLIAFSCIYQG